MVVVSRHHKARPQTLLLALVGTLATSSASATPACEFDLRARYDLGESLTLPAHVERICLPAGRWEVVEFDPAHVEVDHERPRDDHQPRWIQELSGVKILPTEDVIVDDGQSGLVCYSPAQPLILNSALNSLLIDRHSRRFIALEVRETPSPRRPVLHDEPGDGYVCGDSQYYWVSSDPPTQHPLYYRWRFLSKPDRRVLHDWRFGTEPQWVGESGESHVLEVQAVDTAGRWSPVATIAHVTEMTDMPFFLRVALCAGVGASIPLGFGLLLAFGIRRRRSAQMRQKSDPTCF